MRCTGTWWPYRRRTRLLFIFFIVALLLFIWQYSLLPGFYGNSSDQNTGGQHQCDVGDLRRNSMLSAAEDVLRTLSNLQIPYFLCYESLWGALSDSGRPLPWSSYVELCTRNERIAQIDELFFKRQFEKIGLEIDYNGRIGSYSINYAAGHSGRIDGEPLVILVLFELLPDPKQNGLLEPHLRRIGWQHRLLPPNSEGLHQFPEQLINGTLPTRPFGGLKVTVPRESIEIQKYHYRNDWWKRARPPGC